MTNPNSSKHSEEPLSAKSDSSEKAGEYRFWEAASYTKLKSCRFFRRHSFKFLDDGAGPYALFHWVSRWIHLVARQYVEPFKLHPLPVSDQILHWQPVFSRRVSDGLVRLDAYATARSKHIKRARRPYKTLLMRALFATFWRRICLILLGFLLLNCANMSVVFLVKVLLDTMKEKPDSIVYHVALAFVLAFSQFLIGLLMDHLNFYMYRLTHVIQYAFSITIFQHGLVYRRKFASAVNGSNALNVCGRLIHSCAPGSECHRHPLFCPALRYQNRDINSRIFSFEFMDSYYISLFIESTANILQYLFNFLIGFYMVYRFIKITVLTLYIFFLSTLGVMIVVELFNTLILKYIYRLKDYRINKSREVLSGLSLINKMGLDDVAHNIITETRNNELVLLFIRFVLSFLNRLLVNIITSYTVIHVLDDLVEETFKTNDLQNIDTTRLVSAMTVLLKISDSMLFVPDYIKFLTYSLISFFRAEYYMKDCPPNFYISDNTYTGSTLTSSTVQASDQLPSDVVVYYKEAVFTWVNSRKDLLNFKYDVFLKSINFELKRGQLAIVTGVQGSGKSNFIKSLLGEMTLVDGAMAVVPLYTSMPIFYASQDICIQHGTIRSNITFGHKYDAELYNAVLKAVELDYDISTWEKGDMRVVLNNAHTLSGGQRVRVELARAVYAYLVFHKVNMDYNEGKCSFLMCLDSSFHGLDPYVAKSVFNNLFNPNSGLLANDDLSIVLTSTKTALDILSFKPDSYPNLTLYNIVDRKLNVVHETHHPKAKDKVASAGPSTIDYSEMITLCDSEENSGEARARQIIDNYENSLIMNPESKMKGMKLRESFKPYMIYFKSIGIIIVVFVVFTLCYEVIETFKYVLAGNLGDKIVALVRKTNDPKEYINAFSKIRDLCDDTLLKIKRLTVFMVVSSFLANFALTFCCLRGCKRIHEYCIDSLINNNSSVVKIKQFRSEILTFLSSDVFIIDENFGPCLSSLLISFIEVVLQSFVLSYYFPPCIPAAVVCLFVIVYSIFKKFIHASKNLQIASLESLSRINFVCENAISSSSTYRSFKKESKLLDSVMEYTDYCIRSWFYSKSFLAWASFLSKFMFLIMMISTFIIPIIYNQVADVRGFVGHYGLNLMQSLRILFSFTNFVLTIAKLEVLLCSIKRFECFIPPGEKCKFQKYHNIHREDVVLNPEVYKAYGSTEDQLKRSLTLRRKAEYKKQHKKSYFLRALGFRPKINLIGAETHLPEHKTVLLNDVCVYTSTQRNPEGMILKHVTASASKSDIIGIIGRTGAGKTTLLSVLQNLNPNRTGQVLLDGKDLNDIPKAVLRQIIGVLPQLPFVFRGWTIRRFLDPRKLFTDDDINQALQLCDLLNFVNGLPGGRKLDTVLVTDEIALSKRKIRPLYKPPKNKFLDREKTISKELNKVQFDADMMLSSGQIRTLWIAKLVLYRNFYRMIVVDEPPEKEVTDETNLQNEEMGVPIYELLQRHFSHCTTFLTAHDANVLKNCTSVWAVHDGRLVKTFKTSDIAKNESIATIIQESVKLR